MDEVFTKFIFGYPMIFEKKGDQFVVTIEELGIKQQSQSRGRAIREIFEEVKEKNKLNLIEPKKYDCNLYYHNNLQIRLFKINQKITKFGFSVIAEDIKEIDIVKLENICDIIDLNKTYNIKKTQEVENEIIEILEPYIINPHIRALNMSSLIMKTKHLNKFSHIIEQSYISLFKEEYISTVMILIPIIEGILLSLYGFKFTSKKPKEQQLLNKWAELQYNYCNEKIPHPFIVDEYIRAFIDISEQTIFTKHQLARDNSYFNRNYIAHVMGDGRFYSRNNAYKLIHLVDLMAHVLASCSGEHKRYAFDREDINYKLRVHYYKSLKEKKDIEEVQRYIFSSHKNFKGYI
ncbi:hypothetical protein QOZ83_06370 [Romboutsia sedimentorum]|uniref:hypothetical protein n=1 Tax=Romboutsia sedimentorum TaxID=1368474 RepID=UPI0024DE2600|nr:hypothetical protein [Romboutsia sedimentorum]MDK2585485.1 hypothetical protein [Romboutsia sedimentorum]